MSADWLGVVQHVDLDQPAHHTLADMVSKSMKDDMS